MKFDLVLYPRLNMNTVVTRLNVKTVEYHRKKNQFLYSVRTG